MTNRSILYVPDYVVNAAGIVNVAAEYLGWSEIEVVVQVSKIAPRLIEVVDAANDWDISTTAAADRIAQNAIASRATSAMDRAA